MKLYADEAKLSKRWFISIPFIGPRLSSFWYHLATPIHASICFALAESLKDTCSCQNFEIRDLIPLKPFRFRQAFRYFLNQISQYEVETHWTDAGTTPAVDWLDDADIQNREHPLYRDVRSRMINASRMSVWKSLVRIGGKTGWYYGNWLWRLRGFLDRLVGGVGLRRGRRHPEELRPGDALDLWRVHIADPASRLLLVAEMKLPGKAVLDFQIRSISQNQVEIHQKAYYKANGILGSLYWFSVLPFHSFIFQGLIDGIANNARKFHRLDVAIPARIKKRFGSTESTIKNISLGGCQITFSKSIKRKRKVSAWLISNQASFSGAVVNCEKAEDQQYLISIEFKELSPPFKTWLEQLIPSEQIKDSA